MEVVRVDKKNMSLEDDVELAKHPAFVTCTCFVVNYRRTMRPKVLRAAYEVPAPDHYVGVSKALVQRDFLSNHRVSLACRK